MIITLKWRLLPPRPPLDIATVLPPHQPGRVIATVTVIVKVILKVIVMVNLTVRLAVTSCRKSEI